VFILKERTPKDFLVVVGVLVAVKSPVRTSVVVVTVTLEPPCAVGVAVEPGELQSEDASYRMPLMITPSLLMIIFFWSLSQVSGIFLSQQVAEGEAGRLLVWVAFSGPVVLYTERSTTAPVEREVPVIIRAKT